MKQKIIDDVTQFVMIVSLIIIFAFLMDIAFAENMTCGQCNNYTFFNDSDNSTYNNTICSTCAINQNITINTSQNFSYIDNISNMSIYYLVPAPANFTLNVSLLPGENYSDISGNRNISVYALHNYCNAATILYAGQNYSNTTDECNVSFATNNQTLICNITQTLWPSANESVVMNRTEGVCNVLVNIPRFNDTDYAPDGKVAVNKYELFILNQTASSYNITEQQLNWTQSRLDAQNSLVNNLLSSVCAIGAKNMSDAFYSLPTNYRGDYLTMFARIGSNKSVDMWQYSQLIYPPNATKMSPEDTAMIAYEVLNRYAISGVANVSCFSQFYQSLGVNRTACLYSPMINEGCIKIMHDIDAIKSDGVAEGRNTMIILGIMGIGGVFAALIIHARAPIFPWR